MSSSEQIVVLDAGSGTIKAGFAGDDTPKAIFESVLGRPSEADPKSDDIYIGTEIKKLKDMDPKQVSYRPIRNGVVKADDYDDFMKLIKFTQMNELKTTSVDNPLIFLSSPNSSIPFKEKICELAFEELQVNKFQMLNQCASSLQSTGRTTGLVIETGYENTTIMPIYEDQAIQDCGRTMPIAGKHLTEFLLNGCKKLVRNNAAQIEFFDQYSFNKQKEDNCEVAKDKDWNKNVKPNDQLRPMILPDKSEINIDLDRLRTPECMFNASIQCNNMGAKPQLDLQTCIKDSINKSLPLDLKNEIWSNIILSGGNTMFRGFKDRLLLELKAENSNLKSIVSKPERRYAAWIGGSIVSSIQSFHQQYWITKKDYEEKGEGGVSIIHKKCM